MLILKRYVGEIGNKTHFLLKDGSKITITINSIQGRGVMLGIDAPKDINIVRDEIFNKIENSHHSCKKCNHH